MAIFQFPELTVSKIILDKFSKKTDSLYRTSIQLKIKFGQPQLHKNGSEKKRKTCEPTPQLKLIQKEINLYLQEIPLPRSMYGGVKGRNNIMNAGEHINSLYFFTVDLRDFFSNITNKHVHQLFISLGFSWTDARIFTKLTTHKGSLPQGAPTSTALANLIFSKTALELENLCANKNIIFTNFVDDLTFSSKTGFTSYIPKILKILKENGFILNNSKISYRKGCCEITGLLVRGGKLHIEKNMLKRKGNVGVNAYISEVKKYNNARKQKIPLYSS